VIKGRPPRLDRVFPSGPLYFVTFSTRDRKPFRSLTRVHETVKHYAQRAASDFYVAVGRYVIMPDHIHLFVRGDDDFVLLKWVGGLKRAISVALNPGGPLWQPGFFDHVLRSEESYGEKWLYVRNNPVRAGLVDDARDWPYQGECVIIDRL
jgi:putative transposase